MGSITEGKIRMWGILNVHEYLQGILKGEMPKYRSFLYIYFKKCWAVLA